VYGFDQLLQLEVIVEICTGIEMVKYCGIIVGKLWEWLLELDQLTRKQPVQVQAEGSCGSAMA